MDCGFVAMEIKAGAHVSGADSRHLRDLQPYLDKPLLASILLSMDRDARRLAPGAASGTQSLRRPWPGSSP